MANRLQFKKGTGAPGSIFYEAEPVYDKSGKILYIGDVGGSGAGTGSSIASADTHLTVLEMLNKASGADTGKIKLYENTGNGTDYVAIAASAALGSSYTLRLPDSAGSDGQVLKTDGSGNLAWVNQTAGFSGFSISDGTTTEAITSGNTISFAAGSGIDVVVSATDTVTVSLDINELSATSLADTDEFVFYDTSGTSNAKVTADGFRDYVLGGISGAITVSAGGTATLASNSVALGDNTTGNYVTDVTAGLGLFKTSSAIEGQTVDLVLKNADSLNDNTVVGWSTANGNVVNAPITYSGNDVTVAGDLKVTGNNIRSSTGNSAITLSDTSVTINGDLRVVGTAVTFETQVVKVEDRIIELGLVNGGTDNSTTWDLGVAFNYGNGSARKSGIFWIDNTIIGIASAITITDDVGIGDTQPRVTIDTFAPIAAGGLYLGGKTSSDLVINNSREAVNLIFDGGTYN